MDDNEIVQIKKEYKNLQSIKDAVKQEEKKLSATIASQNSSRIKQDSVEKDIQALEAKKESLEQGIVVLHSQAQTATESLSTTLQSKKDTESQISALLAEKKNHEAAIFDLKQKKNEAAAEHETEIRNLEKTKLTHEELKVKQAAELQAEKDRATAAIVVLKNESEAWGNAVATNKAILEQIYSDTKTAIEAKEMADQSQKKSESVLDALKSEIKTAEEKRDSVNAELMDSATNLHKTYGDIEVARETLSGLQKEVDQINASKFSLTRIKSKIDSQMAFIKARFKQAGVPWTDYSEEDKASVE